MDFLVRIEIALPHAMDEGRRRELVAAEVERSAELRADGVIDRIWRIPGRTANVGVWVAEDATRLHAALTSLPLFPWMDIRAEALATHDGGVPGA